MATGSHTGRHGTTRQSAPQTPHGQGTRCSPVLALEPALPAQNPWKPDTSELFQIAYYSCLLISFANSLDPDQARQNVGPDLDPNCLTLINCLTKLRICSVTPSKTNVNYFRPCCIIQPLYHGKSMNEL